MRLCDKVLYDVVKRHEIEKAFSDTERRENMNKDDVLKALNQNNFEIFRCSQGMSHLRLEDDFEILVQLCNGSISEKRMELLKHILQNYETYLTKATQQLKAFQIEIGENYFSYGIYVGEFSFGTHGFQMFDGFTISLKRAEGTIEDYLNLDVYTIQFKSNGHPLGVDLWFE